ncbi:putative oxidoreductase [Pontibacter ummariensis]|uniref:Putative oxidoreductase n=1 Tax=Pontibacter ummariensis TaxID=1610492 RepID=A0A239LPC4_9BACT|nr:DoxX family protein [Pontibacter ummariensis]PRY02937.1 putative oxidoreductase [Pontibacter ummariensis]SNT31494.1 putative oxidoreductase [Pontibacter ummariensis]
MKNSAVQPFILVARILIGITFLVAGMHKVLFWDGPAMWMASKGLPFVPLLLGAAMVTELLGAILLFAGFKVKQTALALVLLLLPMTLMMHTFWNMEGMMQQTAVMDFIQNLAIMGGLVALAAVVHLSAKQPTSTK